MKFEEIPKLESVKRKLTFGVQNNRIPHAQLFLASEGNNGLAMALAYVQYIYCADKKDNDSCGSCSSCIKIQKLTHPDVHFSYPVIGAEQMSTQYISEWREAVLEKKNLVLDDWVKYISKEENKKVNITAEEVRSIIKRLSYKPFEGDANTLIIWLPEYLGREGNMILKLLEEPPQKTYFILVSENSENILTTIKSRTQLVKFPKYTDEEITEIISDRLQLDKTQAQKVAYLADGNLVKAEKLIQELEDDYSEMVRRYLLACYKNDLVEIMKMSDELVKAGRIQVELFLETSLKVLREVLVFQQIENYQIKYREAYVDFITKLSKVLNANFVEEIYSRINESIYHISRNSNGKMTLFNLALEIRYYFIRDKK